MQQEPRRARVVLLALLWLVVLTIGQAIVQGRLAVVPWLGLAPLAASLAVGARQTAIVALASVAAVVGLSEQASSLFSTDGLVRVAGSIGVAVFAVANAAIRVRREDRIRRVTEVATVAQATILHPVPTRVGQLRLASRYVSATADALVGGDLYDVVNTATGVRVIVGDVRGKGLPAVRTTSAVLTSFRHVAPQAQVPLAEVAATIQRELTTAGVLRREDFVTAVLCELRPDGTLDVVNCGHPPPLRLSPGAALQELGPSVEAPPLGLGTAPVTDSFVLADTERLLLYTDGLVEGRDAAGTFVDLADVGARLADPSLSLEDSLDALLAAVRAHVGSVLEDDVAVLLMQHDSAAP